jgi:hypothetical protein
MLTSPNVTGGSARVKRLTRWLFTGPHNTTKRITRDTVLYVLGLAGIAYETLARDGERPTLLLLFAAMVGLPKFLQGDEHSHHEDGKDDDDNRV